jgi:hypothetical protein
MGGTSHSKTCSRTIRMPSRMSSAGSFGIYTSPVTMSGSGAIRDRDDAEYADLFERRSSPRVFAIELLCSDHEGGHRAIGRFALAPLSDAQWLCSMVRHWNLDRPDPR